MLTAVLLALVAVLMPAVPGASEPSPAVLVGTVLGADGRPTSTHTTVRVQERVDGEWRTVSTGDEPGITDRWGHYRVVVPAGSYRVEFEQLDHLTRHVRVTLAPGEERTLDVVLDRGAAITGTVSLPAGGPPANAFVRIYERRRSGGTTTWQQVDYAYVEPSGAWSASGFHGGTYRVGVHPFSDPNQPSHPAKTPYRDEYYDNVAKVQHARDLTVADDGTLTGIDFDLGTAPVTPARKKVTTSRTPRLKGKVRAGRRLRVVLGRLTPADAKVSYRWFAGQRKVAGARRATLRITPRLARKRIRVKVVARAPGHRKLVVRLRASGARPLPR